MIDQQLNHAATSASRVLILELDREGDGFTKIDRFRHLLDVESDPDPELIEFMRVGITDTFAAAEYLSWTLSTGDQTIYATHNPASATPPPPVLYDSCVPQYFPAETVVALDQVRQLMIGFALQGTWPAVDFWTPRSQCVV
ncbi:Imm1 family immunity protein [Saccharopolyspora shandongensis]|uniref:Imm1 family immunity protein n=1 Tax=Saccharopolyspora shandongensis TaxID=418495 RepID=UPI0033DC3890